MFKVPFSSQKKCVSKVLSCEKVDFTSQAGSALAGRGIKETFTALEEKN